MTDITHPVDHKAKLEKEITRLEREIDDKLRDRAILKGKIEDLEIERDGLIEELLAED